MVEPCWPVDMLRRRHPVEELAVRLLQPLLPLIRNSDKTHRAPGYRNLDKTPSICLLQTLDFNESLKRKGHVRAAKRRRKLGGLGKPVLRMFLKKSNAM